MNVKSYLRFFSFATVFFAALSLFTKPEEGVIDAVVSDLLLSCGVVLLFTFAIDFLWGTEKENTK